MKKLLPLFLLLFLYQSAMAQTIGLTSFASGFTSFVEITHAGDSRLFVAQQNGLIRILNADGSINPTPFLNISSIISTGSERGLLGLAFHPDYATNGYFYVNYTNTSGNTVVARYSVNASNPQIANPTGTMIITVNQPFSNHNGGCLRFGPDGYLYISLGDGGSGGDPGNRAQNTNDLLGKLLRIDVDGALPYVNPAGNPFVGTAGADEIWAYGLRNAWKFSFNKNNGDLWIADVGQEQIEEINKVDPTLAGLNYGWRCYEGNSPNNTTGCPPAANLTFPFAQYTHTDTGGCSITGGFVYTGSAYPNFQNKYFFADICVNKVGMVSETGTISYSGNLAGGFYTTFGEDQNGELYVGSSTNGTVYKLVDTDQLGVVENQINSFKIYPNPANDAVFVSSETLAFPATATIFDMTGKLLLKKSIENSQTAIPVSGLDSGIYLLQVVDGSGQQSAVKLSKK